MPEVRGTAGVVVHQTRASCLGGLNVVSLHRSNLAIAQPLVESVIFVLCNKQLTYISF